MPSTERNSEIRELFKATKARFPQQVFEKETAEGLLEDWRDLCQEVGWQRFETAVKRARTYGNFFPAISQIREMVPAPKQEAADIRRELRELEQRRDAGEKFYTLQDVFKEVAQRIKAGKIKPRNPQWIEWAKHFLKSANS